MDTSFYIGMIDGMMALERDAEEDTYGHYEERTELLIDVVGRMAKADVYKRQGKGILHHRDEQKLCTAKVPVPLQDNVL